MDLGSRLGSAEMTGVFSFAILAPSLRTLRYAFELKTFVFLNRLKGG